MIRLIYLVLLTTPIWCQPPAKPDTSSKLDSKPHALGPSDPHKPENRPGKVVYLDYENGFVGMKFGSPLEQFEGMGLVEDFGKLKIYKRDNEIKQLGLATVDSITYEFFEGKLMSVIIRVSGLRSRESLLRLLETAYGRGVRPKPASDECFWGGHVATAHYLPLENLQVYLRVSNNELNSLNGKFTQRVTEEAVSKL